jgi:NADPH:quinone reductase-like Zn-dependent oxidoreductase
VQARAHPEGHALLSSGEAGGHVVGPLGRVVKARALSPFVGQKMVSFTVKPNTQDLQSVRMLVESGDVSPAIDRRYQLAEVPEAIRYLEEGHARGKVVIDV